MLSRPSPELVYALNEAGKLVHISEVAPGAACKCHCPNPACRKPLVAKVRQLKFNRYGRYKAKHFAHEANNACSNAPECALHLLAKEIVECELMLLLPEVRAVYQNRSILLHKAREVKFTKAIIEAKKFESVIPDIYVERDGRRLLVEVYVTHACDQEKLSELKKQGIATVEIDLSTFSRDAAREEVRDAVLRTAPRYWIFHPRIDAAVEEMRSEAERRKQAARQAFNAKIDALASIYQTALNEIETKRVRRYSRSDDFSRLGLVKHIGVKSDGASCFTVPQRVWQHSLIQHAFIPKEGQEASYFQIKALFDWFKERKFVRSEFWYVSPEIEEALVARGIGFATPYRAIEKYLDMLVERKVLVNERGYTLARTLQSKLGQMRRADKLRETRTQDARERVNKILEVIPDHERSGLTAEQWLSVPQANGISFREAIDRDDSGFPEMMQRLGSIEAMLFRKGKVVEDTLNLPIGDQVERRRLALRAEAEAKEAARLEAERLERDRRVGRILGAANRLGTDGEQWISQAKPQFAGQSALQRGQLGDAELDQVLAEISRESRRREILREREEEIAAFRSDLTDDVTRILAEAAGPFLRSPYEDLGNKRPLEYCVSKETYMACLALAEKVRKQRAARRR